MSAEFKTSSEVANKNIASLYVPNDTNISGLPKLIQSHIKHCVHHLAQDVMIEHEPFEGKVRTHKEWSYRQIAHCLGDIEELVRDIAPDSDWKLDEEVVNLIKKCMYRTAKFAHKEYLKMTGETDESPE